jgi:hypothetical protein
MAILNTRFVAAFAWSALAACTPEIVAGAYFCGPEMSCPSGFACDGPSNTCVRPGSVQPFACDFSLQDREPDDDVANAPLLGIIPCAPQRLETTGCIADGVDVDIFALTSGDCAMQVEIRATYATAFAPVAIDILDDTGELLAPGELCGTGAGGEDVSCADLITTANTTYLIRFVAADEADCDGLCSYNRYEVSIGSAAP